MGVDKMKYWLIKSGTGKRNGYILRGKIKPKKVAVKVVSGKVYGPFKDHGTAIDFAYRKKIYVTGSGPVVHFNKLVRFAR